MQKEYGDEQNIITLSPQVALSSTKRTSPTYGNYFDKYAKENYQSGIVMNIMLKRYNLMRNNGNGNSTKSSTSDDVSTSADASLTDLEYVSEYLKGRKPINRKPINAFSYSSSSISFSSSSSLSDSKENRHHFKKLSDPTRELRAHTAKKFDGNHVSSKVRTSSCNSTSRATNDNKKSKKKVHYKKNTIATRQQNNDKRPSTFSSDDSTKKSRNTTINITSYCKERKNDPKPPDRLKGKSAFDLVLTNHPTNMYCNEHDALKSLSLKTTISPYGKKTLPSDKPPIPNQIQINRDERTCSPLSQLNYESEDYMYGSKRFHGTSYSSRSLHHPSHYTRDQHYMIHKGKIEAHSYNRKESNDSTDKSNEDCGRKLTFAGEKSDDVLIDSHPQRDQSPMQMRHEHDEYQGHRGHQNFIDDVQQKYNMQTMEQSTSKKRQSEVDKVDEWRQVVPPNGSKPYYYNRHTRESRWTLPPNAKRVSVKTPRKCKDSTSNRVDNKLKDVDNTIDQNGSTRPNHPLRNGSSHKTRQNNKLTQKHSSSLEDAQMKIIGPQIEEKKTLGNKSLLNVTPLEIDAQVAFKDEEPSTVVQRWKEPNSSPSYGSFTNPLLTEDCQRPGEKTVLGTEKYKKISSPRKQHHSTFKTRNQQEKQSAPESIYSISDHSIDTNLSTCARADYLFMQQNEFQFDNDQEEKKYPDIPHNNGRLDQEPSSDSLQHEPITAYCPYCGIACGNLASMESHLSYPCSVLMKWVSSPTNVAYHRSLQQILMRTWGKSFLRTQSEIAHIELHGQHEPYGSYEPSETHEGGQEDRQLRIDVENTLKEKNMLCYEDFPSQTSSSRSAFRSNIVNHKSNQEEICDTCGRTFAQGRLAAHARVCGKIFTPTKSHPPPPIPSTIPTPMTSDITPINSVCPFCEKTYDRGEKLSAHLLKCPERKKRRSMRVANSGPYTGLENSSSRSATKKTPATKMQSLLLNGGRELPGYPKL